MGNNVHTDATFGEVIKNRRIELGYTQKELEERTGIHHSQISRIERDELKPTKDNVLALARGLDANKETMLYIAGFNYKWTDSILGFLSDAVIQKNNLEKMNFFQVENDAKKKGELVEEYISKLMKHSFTLPEEKETEAIDAISFIPSEDFKTDELDDQVFIKNRFLALNRDSSTCRYCGAKAPYTTVEVERSCLNRDYSLDNLITICSECNLGKKMIQEELSKKEIKKADKKILNEWEIDLNDDLNKLDTGLVDNINEIGTRVNVHEGLPED